MALLMRALPAKASRQRNLSELWTKALQVSHGEKLKTLTQLHVFSRGLGGLLLVQNPVAYGKTKQMKQMKGLAIPPYPEWT